MKTASQQAIWGAFLLGLFTLILATGATRRAAAADVNTIAGITSIKTSAGTTIEITLNSSREFEMRDDILLLQIGTTTFHVSHAPSDGSLSTVIFALSPAEFAALKTGDPVTVYYSTSTPTGADSWIFGKLDKSSLKQ